MFFSEFSNKNITKNSNIFYSENIVIKLLHCNQKHVIYNKNSRKFNEFSPVITIFQRITPVLGIITQITPILCIIHRITQVLGIITQITLFGFFGFT